MGGDWIEGCGEDAEGNVVGVAENVEGIERACDVEELEARKEDETEFGGKGGGGHFWGWQFEVWVFSSFPVLFLFFFKKMDGKVEVWRLGEKRSMLILCGIMHVTKYFL